MIGGDTMIQKSWTAFLCFSLALCVAALSSCGSQASLDDHPDTESTAEVTEYIADVALSETASPLLISVQPEDVSVDLEQEAVFTVAAENYDSVNWFFVDPGEEFSVAAKDVLNVFPGLNYLIENADGLETLTIRATPVELNGWFVQCVFYNADGNEAASSKAKIQILNMPEEVEASAEPVEIPEEIRHAAQRPTPQSTAAPSPAGSLSPTATPAPSQTPTLPPAATPTPAATPSPSPSASPTPTTTPAPTPQPTATPKPTPTPTPAPSPSPTPSHTHSWQPVYITVHHDAVTEQHWVVDEPAWDEDIYTLGERCKCGAWFPDRASLNAHRRPLIESGNDEVAQAHASFSSSYQKTGTVHHDEVGHYETVTITGAYDEQVIDHYECACGETKPK